MHWILGIIADIIVDNGMPRQTQKASKLLKGDHNR